MTIAKYNKEELESMSHVHLVHVVLLLQKQVFDEKKTEAPEKTSENSSIPPSRDNPYKSQNTSREKSSKKSGGQIWHKGVTRPYEEATETIECKPTIVDGNWMTVDETKVRYTVVSKHRVLDVNIEKKITEYVVYQAKYEWQEYIWELPNWISTGGFQIWPWLQSIVWYMNIYHKLPYARLQWCLKDMLKIDISQWSINNILTTIGAKLEKPYQEIVQQIKKSNCVGSDETWNKVNGKLMRIWIWQNSMRNYYYPSMNRWYKTVKESFGEDFSGVLVHDCYSAQNNTNAWGHQLCLEHIKRELKLCVQEWGWYGVIAWKMLRLIRKSRKAQAWLIDKTIDSQYQQRIHKYYVDKMRDLCLQCESAWWTIRKLAKRFIKHMDKMFLFLQNLIVPRHNNASEKWLRMQKVHQKVSWWFRSFDGAKINCMILSLIESMKKQSRNVLDCLYLVCTNQFQLIEAE